MTSHSSDEPRPPFDPRRIPRDEGLPPPTSPRRRRGVEPQPRASESLFGDEPPAPAAPPAAPARSSPLAGVAKSQPISVSQLNRLVKSAIAAGVPQTVVVLGELSNVSRASGGHVYFTLKDAGSEVRCVMWRSDAASLKFEMKDGLEVVATGSVDVYEARGQYQLYVRRLEPRGVGALELAFQQLRDRLSREGLFDAARKRRLPRLPRTIAVLTSPTGAAIRDVLQTIERRFPRVRVLVYGVRVQGEGAADEIADAIARVNESRDDLGGVDVLIVGRGGGSLEDLWAFNEEIVARAIYASRIPVISAVGHEVDFTIADFVADVRAATPTAAAELVVPVLDDLLAAIESARHRLSQAMRREIQLMRQRVDATARMPWYRDPVGLVRRRALGLDDVAGRLRLALSRLLARRVTRIQAAELALVRNRPEVQVARRLAGLTAAEHRLARSALVNLHRRERQWSAVCGRLSERSPRARLERLQMSVQHSLSGMSRAMVEAIASRRRRLDSVAARLDAASHERVLGRGFSITRMKRDGRIVRRPGDVRPGDRIETETAGGRFVSDVEDERQGELFET